MGEATKNCVKLTMFGFNLIFFIIGIGLIAGGAVAQLKYVEYTHFFDYGITVPVFLIIIGVFIMLISFLGCCGAARDNYYMLMGFAVLVGLIFICQVAGGIAGYVQRGKVEETILKGMRYEIDKVKTHPDQHKSMFDLIEKIQEEEKCCGADNFTNWINDNNNSTIVVTQIPPSCCKDKNNCDRTAINNINCDLSGATDKGATCPVRNNGCAAPSSQIMKKALDGAAGAALGLAVIELFGVIFACYLAKRIRSGYVYA